MLEGVVLLAFCFLAALIGLAVVAIELISGDIFSMDGLWLSLISLTLAAVFGGNLVWSFYAGEAQQLLRNFRRRSVPDQASAEKRQAE